MNAVSNFEFDGMLVRVFERDSTLWFVAADVARALEFRDAANALRSVPDRERGTHKVSTLGGEQDALCVTEQGLYRLIFRSNKDEAKRFQDFVFYVVLPQIRKTGSYQPSNPDPVMTPQQMDIRLALDMVREARLIHGKQRAARLWESLPMLPRVPEIPVLQHANHAAGAACLAHLLAYRIETGESVAELITLAMESGDALDMRLRSLGIRPITEGEPGIAIATNPVLTGGLFHDTRWDKGRHIGALRSLPGVISFRHIKVQKNATSSSIFIPAELLEEGCD